MEKSWNCEENKENGIKCFTCIWEIGSKMSEIGVEWLLSEGLIIHPLEMWQIKWGKRHLENIFKRMQCVNYLLL